MEPLSITTSIIAILKVTTRVLSFLNNLKNASKELSSLAIEATNLCSLLTQLRFRLDDEDAKSNQAWYTCVRSLNICNGPLDQYKEALEKVVAKCSKLSSESSKEPYNKLRQGLRWTFSKEETAGILSKIERLKSLVAVALEMDHFKLSQAINLELDTVVDDNLPRLHQGISTIQDTRDSAKRRQILAWISQSNFPAEQSDLIERRQEGTCQWLLDSEVFRDWLIGSTRTLFCPGIPGAGKTMMAATTIDHLSKSVCDDSTQVAYIYCNYKEHTCQTTRRFLAAILQQLLSCRASISDAAARLYEKHEPTKTKPSLKEIFSVLQTTIADYTSVFTVVDALDEFPNEDGERDLLLMKIAELQSCSDLRLMVTSRHIPEIEKAFEAASKTEIRASEFDVKRYVSGQIARLPKCIQNDQALQEAVLSSIANAVDGMFLLARLHVDSLLDKRTKAKVLSTLEQLPKGSAALGKAYDMAIERIENQLPEDSAMAKSALLWISFARRLLTTEELCHILATRPGDKELNVDNVADVEDIVSVCAGLVVVDDGSNVIRLVHYTLQEYLLQTRDSWSPTARNDVAEACLTYLSFDTFRSGRSYSKKLLENKIRQYSFLRYAAQNWGHHALQVGDDVLDSVFEMLQDSALSCCALQVIYHDEKGHFSHCAQSINGLHLVAFLGLPTILKDMLKRTIGEQFLLVNGMDDRNATPLSYAARRGYHETVKAILEQCDVLPNIADETGNTPLMRAAENGHATIVRLLLDRSDVDAGLQNDCGNTALANAVAKGNLEVVKMLLQRSDANVEAKDNNGDDLLAWAVLYGRESVVDLLLNDGRFSPTAVNARGFEPLHIASGAGREAVARRLLERGITPNIRKTGLGTTPLMDAVFYGHAGVAKLLLQYGADVSVQDNEGTSALTFAAMQGDVDTVKLLLEHGADTSCQDSRRWTALKHAGEVGDEEVVNLLLGNRAAEVSSTHSQTALPSRSKERSRVSRRR